MEEARARRRRGGRTRRRGPARWRGTPPRRKQFSICKQIRGSKCRTQNCLNITLTSSSQRQSDLQTSAWTGSCWRASSDEARSSSAATWCCLITLKLSPKWSTNLSILLELLRIIMLLINTSYWFIIDHFNIMCVGVGGF